MARPAVVTAVAAALMPIAAALLPVTNFFLDVGVAFTWPVA